MCWQACLVLCFLCSICWVRPQGLDDCDKATNCHECITIAKPNCIWCSKPDMKLQDRCKSQDSIEDTWCDDVDTTNNTVKIYRNHPTNSKAEITAPTPGDSAAKFKPHGYKINLRAGVPEQFTFSIELTDQYPVDIYFIFDASKTMEAIKDMTIAQGDALYKAITNITTNVRFGVGTFVEKNAYPYTDHLSNEIYSYKNQLQLTTDNKKFFKAINNIKLTKNKDAPESGLDALAQAIVCKEEIGWREESRKIIVLFTDGYYHAAGDGKFGNINQPYDGKCYTKNGSYENSLKMDYPSVSIINKLAFDNDVTIMFVVHDKVKETYEWLSESIRRSKLMLYGDDDSEVQKVLESLYSTIKRSLSFKHYIPQQDKKYFQITYEPNCISTLGEQTQECALKLGGKKELKASITLLKYYGAKNTKIEIINEGFKEKLVLDIEIITECTCDKENNSAKCKNRGTYECGICRCNTGSVGPQCECLVDKLNDSTSVSDEQCMKDNSTHTKECSGHGICTCGFCKCMDRFWGPFCECNKDDCPRGENGATCTGHGSCDCFQKCVCDAGYEGDVCQCPLSNELCMVNGKECNGKGHCDCGKCKCSKRAEWDARPERDPYCKIQSCPNCHDAQCTKLTACASCLHNHYNDITKCPDVCVKTIILDDVNSTLPIGLKRENCTNVRVSFGCYTWFTYVYVDFNDTVLVYAHTDSDCAESYYIPGVIALIVALIVGVATILIWKYCVDLRDRREYEQFIRSHPEDCEPEQVNPTYVAPTLKYRNPMFGKSISNY